MANKPRNTFKYHFIKDRKVVHRGITTDLERREQEHQRAFGGGRIKQIGYRTTEPAAREWEAEGGKR
jgi:predicted GIY-YIG superfamily endonuclease